MKLRTLAIFAAGFLGCLGVLALLAGEVRVRVSGRRVVGPQQEDSSLSLLRTEREHRQKRRALSARRRFSIYLKTGGLVGGADRDRTDDLLNALSW